MDNSYSDILSQMRSWFAAYARTFLSSHPQHEGALQLKIAHTGRVCAEARGIIASLGIDARIAALAEMAALLHDAGRFEQVCRYGSYLDPATTDHAVLGEDVIRRENVLGMLDEKERRIVLTAVRNHNRPQLDGHIRGEERIVCAVVRDADKLDIYNILSSYYAGTPVDASVTVGLPDSPEISEELCHALMRGGTVKFETMRTVNDFKLLKLGWVFDINFQRTMREIKRRKYLEIIGESLPQTECVKAIRLHVGRYLDDRCNSGG